MDIDSWVEKQEDMIVFHFAHEQSNILQELIKICTGNRITTVFQSRGIIKCRMIADRLTLPWLHIFCNRVEDYQAGTGLPHNTKEMLLEAIEFERFLALQRSRYAGLTEVGQGQSQSK